MPTLEQCIGRFDELKRDRTVTTHFVKLRTLEKNIQSALTFGPVQCTLKFFFSQNKVS